MFMGVLETSKIHENRIKDLRIQVSTLCIYNFLMSSSAIIHDELEWDYNISGRSYADRIGIYPTAPLILPAFGPMFSFLSMFCSSIMIIPIFMPIPDFRNYLLPGIIWNIYAVIAHCNNLLEIAYNFAEPATISFFFNLISAGSFLLSLHLMLILQTLVFYDYLIIIPKDMKDISLWEVDECFKESSESSSLLDDLNKPYSSSEVNKAEAGYLTDMKGELL